MTVKVYTDRRNYKYDDAESFFVDEDGRLVVEGVAIFNNQEWQHAEKEAVVSTERTPRVWKSIMDIPANTSVIDNDGDKLWILPNKQAWWGGEPPYDLEYAWEYGKEYDEYAPFTEVLS